jgi:hypothetical protein
LSVHSKGQALSGKSKSFPAERTAVQGTVRTFAGLRHAEGMIFASLLITLYREAIMRHHLTAVFNNRSDAQHVLDELLIAGYPRSGTTLVSPPTGGADDKLDAGPGSTVRQLFVRLFGSRPKLPEREDEPGSLPGRHVVNVSAATEPESLRAIGIIERFSPVYIEDRQK